MKRDDHNLESLDAILRHATAQPPGPPTPQCADSETLAAYYDRSLAEADRDRLEAHFADCARCQAQLAAIARADEAGASARPHREISWLRPLIVVPAIAAAAAVLVVVRSMRSSNDEFRGTDQVATAKHEAPLMDLAARAPAPVSPPTAATTRSAPASNELALNEAKPASPRVEHRDELRAHRMSPARESHLRKSEGEVIASAPSHKASGDVASPEAAPASEQPPVSASAPAGAISAPAQAGSSEPPPTAAVPAPAPPYAMSQSSMAPRALARSASSFAAQNSGASETSSAAPVGGAVAGAAIGAGSGAAQVQLPEQATRASSAAAIGRSTAPVAGLAMPSAGASPEVLAMISPTDQKSGWQVGKNGMILRRDPDGTTHPQHSGVTTDLTAGAAPSSTVCWIVGRSGTIIRTTDGEHWELITAPTADNLVAVASDSANHAVVTTASGQSFATSDGGSSWHRN